MRRLLIGFSLALSACAFNPVSATKSDGGMEARDGQTVADSAMPEEDAGGEDAARPDGGGEDAAGEDAAGQDAAVEDANEVRMIYSPSAGSAQMRSSRYRAAITIGGRGAQGVATSTTHRVELGPGVGR